MIIFLYGENDFKINSRIHDFKKKFIKDLDPSGQNIFTLDGEKMKIDDLSAQIGTASLFVKKKIIIINDLSKNKQKDFIKIIFDYIKKNKIEEAQDIFVFVENFLKNKGEKGIIKMSGGKESALTIAEKNLFNYLKNSQHSQEMKNYSNPELIDIIKKEFKNNKLTIENRLIQKTINLCSSDPWTIKNEIKKIIHLKLSNKENRTISQKDIEENISEEFQENIFALTDAISAKNKKDALKMLEEQYLAGASPDYILSMLSRQFKILLQIKEALRLNYSPKRMVNSLRLHPFVVNKSINQARNFDKEGLKRIINELINLDKENRTKSINLKPYINLIITEI